jgi:hypothetical protein
VYLPRRGSVNASDTHLLTSPSAHLTADPLVDVLNLRLCTIGLCVPACFNDCNCILPDGTPCGETTRFPTAAPTPVAPTPSPGPKTCAKINGEAACSTLMDPDNIPVGVDCYCYNFCNGSFLSCCNEDQTCSPKVCETGAMVEVNGCVDGDFVSGGMPSPPSPGSPTTNPPSMAYMGQSSPVVAALVTLVLLIQRW